MINCYKHPTCLLKFHFPYLKTLARLYVSLTCFPSHVSEAPSPEPPLTRTSMEQLGRTHQLLNIHGMKQHISSNEEGARAGRARPVGEGGTCGRSDSGLCRRRAWFGRGGTQTAPHAASGVAVQGEAQLRRRGDQGEGLHHRGGPGIERQDLFILETLTFREDALGRPEKLGANELMR